MTTRILSQAVSLSLFVCAARAADVAVDPVVAPDAGNVVEVTVVEVVNEPVIAVCPGPVEFETVSTKPEVEEPEVVVCEGVEGEVVEGEVVECEVIEVVDIRHYSGSEVERGGGDVDPVIMYSTGVVTLGGETGGVSLDQGISGSGIAAVAALKVDLADLTATARELKVLDTAGDIVISD